MIEVEGLTKQFEEHEVLRGLTFTIPQGEVVALLGVNGAGKTTTLRVLTTYYPPTAGRVVVAGFDVVRSAEQVRANIGYLPENPPLYPEMKVGEYLQFVAQLKGLHRGKIGAAVRRVIEECALEGVVHSLCAHLSKGFRQRVGIAQAIINRPAVVILDEPTSGLDPAQIVDTRKLIASLAGQHTVLLSTHLLQEVHEVCTSVVMISEGRVCLQGKREELQARGDLERQFIELAFGGRVAA